MDTTPNAPKPSVNNVAKMTPINVELVNVFLNPVVNNKNAFLNVNDAFSLLFGEYV